VRWDTSTQCLARDAMADVEVAGVRIPAGSQCFVAFSACRCAFESSEVRAALLTLIFRDERPGPTKVTGLLNRCRTSPSGRVVNKLEMLSMFASCEFRVCRELSQ